jgi:hypothetical protein
MQICRGFRRRQASSPSDDGVLRGEDLMALSPYHELDASCSPGGAECLAVFAIQRAVDLTSEAEAHGHAHAASEMGTAIRKAPPGFIM